VFGLGKRILIELVKDTKIGEHGIAGINLLYQMAIRQNRGFKD
jgi:hypothetical protein